MLIHFIIFQMNLQNYLPIFLGIVAVLGDKTLQLTSNDLHRAFVDNLTHGMIGLISWLIIVLKSYKYKTYVINLYGDVILSWAIAALIDVDHFVLAKSFKLEDALRLGEKRPILHCSTVPFALLFITNISNWLWRLPGLAYFGWLVWVSTFSHHVRDGHRRGLWFWPVGSTVPIPYFLYIIITMFIPHLAFLAMLNLDIFKQNYIYSNISVV